MAKKILAICAALVAFAAMAAAPALASPNLTLRKNGVAVPVGTSILATNEGNIVLDTSVGAVTCNSSTLTGSVTTNSGTEVAGTISHAHFTGTGSEGKCTTAFIGDVKVDPEALHWCIKGGGKLATDKFEIRGGGCTEGTKNLQFTLTGSANCTYTRANVTGTYTTTGTQAHLTIDSTLNGHSNQVFNGAASNGFLCPSTGTLTGTYKLESDDGLKTPLTLDDVA